MEPNVDKNQLSTITNPQSLITMAIDKGVNIEQLEKLLAMKERWDAQQANKEFLFAMSNFQKDVPVIEKKKGVNYPGKTGGNVSYKYAELGEIDETIKQAMASNGLSKRWEISEDGDKLICTCIISHIDGHKEHTTMSSLKDSSGNKNEIQSRASAISYLQRYTLIGALGLTTASEDNDGDGTPPAKQTNTQSYNSDLPWLNINDKQGNKTQQGKDITHLIAIGKTTIDELRTEYKLSKIVVDELSKIVVNKQANINTDKIETASIIDGPATEFEDDQPFEIPGLWYARLEKCKSKKEILAVYIEHKATIDAHPELQQLLKEYQSKIQNQTS